MIRPAVIIMTVGEDSQVGIRCGGVCVSACVHVSVCVCL